MQWRPHLHTFADLHHTCSGVFQLHQWRQLALHMIVFADPCALVTHHVAAPGAGGQQASLQLPHGMGTITLAEWPRGMRCCSTSTSRLQLTLSVICFQMTTTLVASGARVALLRKKASIPVYPDNVLGTMPPNEQKHATRIWCPSRQRRRFVEDSGKTAPPTIRA